MKKKSPSLGKRRAGKKNLGGCFGDVFEECFGSEGGLVEIREEMPKASLRFLGWGRGRRKKVLGLFGSLRWIGELLEVERSAGVLNDVSG